MATKSPNFQSYLSQLTDLCQEYLVKKAPALPSEWKEFIVKIAPWLAVIGVILGIPGILAIFGLGAILAPFSFLGGVVTGRPFLGITYLLNIAFLVVIVVLEALAIPGLFKRSQRSWNLLYYSVLVSIVQNIISFNIGGLIIGGLLSLYILFQVKEYYK